MWWRSPSLSKWTLPFIAQLWPSWTWHGGAWTFWADPGTSSYFCVGNAWRWEISYRWSHILQTQDQWQFQEACLGQRMPLFNPTDFSRSLLLDLHSESTSVEEIYSKTLKTDDHIKECQLLLHEYKCLILIDGLRSRKKTDGLQSKEDWNWIKSNLIKYGDSGSCIITITCEECVAKHCADQRVAPPLDQPSFPPRNTIFATLEWFLRPLWFKLQTSWFVHTSPNYYTTHVVERGMQSFYIKILLYFLISIP